MGDSLTLFLTDGVLLGLCFASAVSSFLAAPRLGLVNPEGYIALSPFPNLSDVPPFLGWQRKRFPRFWRNKSQAGRPRIPPDLQRLNRMITRDNPSWGEERIANELRVKLGLRVSPRTIRKYLPKFPITPAATRAVISVGRAFSRILLRPSSPATSSS